MNALYWLLGIVVVAGGAWMVMGSSNLGLGGRGEPEVSANMQAQESANGASQMGDAESSTFTGSMQDLMARSGSWQCDVSVTTEGITSTGTTYVSGGKVRADFSSEIPQIGKMESHMIMRENTAYTWTSMMNRGFKFPIKGNEVEPEVSAEMAAQVNQDYNYNCKVWSADESKFALPSGITF